MIAIEHEVQPPVDYITNAGAIGPEHLHFLISWMTMVGILTSKPTRAQLPSRADLRPFTVTLLSPAISLHPQDLPITSQRAGAGRLWELYALKLLIALQQLLPDQAQHLRGKMNIASEDPLLQHIGDRESHRILQAAEYHNFGFHTAALAVNLLDRFMAAQPTSDEELWTLQLAAVACLSIAAKMEEGIMPADITELQVGSLPATSPAQAHLHFCYTPAR